MELVQMKCPNCNADLEVENSIDSFYCKYCGTKILVEGQSKHVVNAKAKIRMMDKLGDMQKEYHRRKEEEAKRSAEQAKKMVPWFIGFFVFMIGLLIFVGFMSEASEKKEEQRLEAIYAEIQTDIANGDYTEALVKANGLHFSGGGSDDRKKWDKIREGTIEIIEDLK